ncbi:MAG: trimethylamine methyltransferase family protein [Planctomycetota bacterium]
MAQHEQPGLKSSLYRPLSADDRRQVADSAFEVLETTGMAVYSDTAFEVLREAGAEVDGEDRRVRLPRSMVEDAIASTPSSLTLHSRDGNYDARLEQDRVHYGTGGTAIYVLDPDSGERRPSKTGDVILNARLADRLENVHVFTINVFPNEIEAEDEIDVNRFFHSLDNTTRHVMGGIYSLEGSRKVVEMAEMLAGGEEELRREPFVSFITLIISPFKIDQDYGEMTCFFARKGLPVVVPTEPMCGTTAPVTLAGNVLVHTAETLAGVTLVQAVNEGAPAICGSVGSISDLRSMSNLAGPVERGMINAGVSQMAQHFQIPFYGTAGTTDAKEVDAQSSYESAMSSLLVAMSGANYIHDIAGLMEFDLTVSYEKMVIDNEILGMCQRVLRGIEVDEETLGLEMLKRKKPGEDYLAEPHTVEHMRDEFFMPELSNRNKRENYSADENAEARARKIVNEVRRSDADCKIPTDIREKIIGSYPEIRDDAEVV